MTVQNRKLAEAKDQNDEIRAEQVVASGKQDKILENQERILQMLQGAATFAQPSNHTAPSCRWTC